MLPFSALVVLAVMSVGDVHSPRPTGWVSDEAGILDATARRRINDLAEQIHDSRGIEIAVVTVDDVPGTPKQFATALFKAWGIGSARSNNGILVLLVVARRRLEVETGTGIESALSAEWLASMEKRVMVPRFKAGDFAGGLVDGVGAIEQQIRSAPAESTSVAPPGEYRSDGSTDRVEDSGGSPGATTAGDPRWGFLIGAGAGVLGIALWLGIRRFRRRGLCRVCVPPRRMIELDEVADDAYLESGQRMEEIVGSVDYTVLLCTGCHATRTRRKLQLWTAWSGYRRCSSCSYKTSHTLQSTLKSASYSGPGEVEVRTTCAHCGHDESYRYEVPMLTQVASFSSSSSGSGSDSGSFSWSSSDTSSSTSDSSSSSDSGSSGFSGGGSHGGGAGSSW